MWWFVPAFDVWLNLTLAGLALSAVAALAVLLVREPARKIRVIQLALVGLLALPLLALAPGYPRVGGWAAVAEKVPVALAESHEIEQPSALSAGSASVPLIDERASSDEPLALGKPPALPVGSSLAPPTGEPAPSFEAGPAAEPVATTPRTEPFAQAATRPPAAPTVVVKRPATEQRPSISPLPDFRLLILVTYAAGVAVFALWWALGRVALWRLLRHAVPAEPELRALLDDVAAAHATGPAPARVRLLVSSRAMQPCACGWLRPAIVLPLRVVKELSPNQLRLALSHEWSHVARGDLRTWMLAGVVRLVFFHLPPVWLLRRELRVSQDYLADAAAASGSTPEDYAELLTTLSRMFRPTSLSPGLGIAPRSSDLYRRVIMLVDRTRPLERTIPRRWNVAAVALGVALIAGAATLRAEPEKNDPASTPPAAELPEPATSKTAPLPTPLDGPPPPLPEDTSFVPAPVELQPVQPAAPPDNRSAASRAWGELALQVITVRKELEDLLKTRKQLETMLRHEDAQDHHEKIASHLAALDDACFEHAKQLKILEAQLRQAELKLADNAAATAANWEKSSDKRRLLEALLSELDEVLKSRDAMLKQAAAEKDPAERARQEAHIRRSIDPKRVELVYQIDVLLQPAATRTLAPATTELPRGQRPSPPARWIDELLERDPQISQLRQDLAAQQESLRKLKESAAPQFRLREAMQAIMQIEEQIEEIKSQRLPVLLESVSQAGNLSATPASTVDITQARLPIRSDLLANMMLENDPQLVKLRQSLATEQRALDRLRSSDASQNDLKTTQQRVLQIEQEIEEIRASRKPALLELIAAANETRGRPVPAERQVAASSQPFSGRIRPGDILGIELVGGFPTPLAPTRTVEPDGNLALGPVYGPASRVKVAGLTLIEAGQEMEKQLRAVLREPKVMLTYEGHNDGVVAEGAPEGNAAAAPAAASPAASPRGVSAVRPRPGMPASVPAAEPVILQPLDTIQIIAPTRGLASFGGGSQSIGGTYVIEADGRVPLSFFGDRIKLAGLTEEEAGAKVREFLSGRLDERTALPTTRVLRRGRAVFPEGKQPAQDYKVAAGDSLLVWSNIHGEMELKVDSDGNAGWPNWQPTEQTVRVVGLTLEEAQAAFRKTLKVNLFESSLPPTEASYRTVPWIVTLGGWREDADLRIIDQIEGGGATQLLRMQEEMQELKAMIRKLQAE